MSFQSLLLWPENPGLSIVVLVVVAMGFMYAARRPVHELLRALGHMIGGPLRIAARSLAQAAADIHHRNKAVLLAHGRQELGSRVEREFERLALLRRAFMDTMQDKAFLAEADKIKLEITPVTGEAVQKLVAEIYSTPPEIVRRAAQAVK